MSLTLKPYPEYKDSGLPWLGKIPAHWCVRRAKHLFTAVDVRSDQGSEELLTVSSSDGVVLRREKNVTMFKAESYVGHKLCWPGDLVINSLWAWARGLGFSQYHGIVSSAYGVYRPKPAVVPATSYLNLLLRSAVYDWELRIRSKGIWVSRLQLTDESFFDMPIVVPTAGEASSIATFLEVQDRRIRKLIRAKRRVIELLNEQKQAIIHRAVTRGLDPNVRLKPSGVEWLGDLPEHWQISSLRRCLLQIEQGWSPVAAEGELEPEQYGVLTLSSVRRGKFCPKAIKPIEKDAQVPLRIEVHEGDFLLTRSNTRDRVGDVCVAEGVRARTILCDLIYRLRLKEKSIGSEYLMYVLLSPLGRRQIESDARGSSGTMPKLSQEHIKCWRIPVPPIQEQHTIADAIRQEAFALNDAIIRADREIVLLREYRTRLIADVVTGKLDVRGVELPEVEVVEEPNITDETMEEEDEELVGAEEGDDVAN